jgi:hypothetical protein
MEYGQKVKIFTEQKVNPGLSGMSIVDGKVMLNTATVMAETEVEILGHNDKEVTFRLDDGQIWTQSLDQFAQSQVTPIGLAGGS